MSGDMMRDYLAAAGGTDHPTAGMLTVRIDCPMSHPSGWDCDGTLTVLVTAPGLEYAIVGQTCQCDPLAIDSTKLFWTRMDEALAGAWEAGR